MNQTNAGTSNGCSTITNVFAVSKKKANAKTSRFSTSVVMFGSMLMLALQLLSGSAHAVNIPVSSFTCTQTMTATTTCVGSGFFASGWNSGTGYWQYQLNTVGYSGAITMTFSNTKSSAAGPTSGQVYYNIGAGDVAVTGGAFGVTTSCASQVITLPAVCAGVSNLIVKVKMLGATASTATHRISAQNVFDAASAGCSGSPATGTVTAGTNPLCGGSTTALSLTGASAGVGITYQWQSSPNNSTWTNVSGATSLTYNATPATSTYYRVVTTCTNGTPVSANSASLLVTVNNVTIAAITGLTSPATVGQVQNLSDATTGGLWLSSDASVASIDAAGHLTPNFGGSAVISYQVTDFTTGCVGSKTANVNVIWPNTLALYAGVNGNSTNVINVPGDVTSTLYNTGFGAATPCTSGGYSGLTVDVTDTVAVATAPHVGYKVYATTGHDLNFYRIHAAARVSGTGPTKARIAFRTWQGGSTLGWRFEAADQALTSGSCGSSANSWDYNTGDPVNPNPTFNGIDSMEVAVFPFAPGASTGTFQLNSLEVYGLISGDTDCTVVNAPVDSVLPAIVNICDSGKRFLNYNIGTGGVAGFDILYQWEVSTNNGVTWTPIPGAEGVVYQTPMLNTSAVSDTFMYRVKVTCDNSGAFNYSQPNIVSIHATPSGAGTITGAVSSANLPFDHMLIGSTYTMSSTVAGGTWSSNDTSVVSINPTSGLATPNIQGDAIITYRAAVGGCFGSSKDTVVAYHPNTKALYVGQGGSSVNFYTAAGTTASNLALTNWGASTTCGNGGISGLTNTTTTVDQSTNGSAVTTVGGSFAATKIYATLRDQNSGTYQAYLAYKLHSASTWIVSPSEDVEADDCGYSHNELQFNAPVTVGTGSSAYDFAVFGYNGTATTTLQINSLSIIGGGAALMNGVGTLAANTDVRLYPNPVENTLNVTASQNVNVVIMSIDGKKLLDQKNATSINVSNLMSGMYLIQVYDESNKTLLKTEKFVKK